MGYGIRYHRDSKEECGTHRVHACMIKMVCPVFCESQALTTMTKMVIAP